MQENHQQLEFSKFFEGEEWNKSGQTSSERTEGDFCLINSTGLICKHIIDSYFTSPLLSISQYSKRRTQMTYFYGLGMI